MPEIGLGIGRFVAQVGGIQRELLYWYDAQGVRYQTGEELAEIERNQRELAQQQAELERQRSNEMAELLERYRDRFGDLTED
jgi:predicted transcriptional regulator